ncbi:MAG: hypothetical protein RLZZ586_1097 [Pseudomonadota bacterium]
MAALVLVEHDHHSLKAATHHAVSAAAQQLRRKNISDRSNVVPVFFTPSSLPPL